MRSELKDHGKDQMWVGPPELQKYTNITIENVVSTAKAYRKNLDRLMSDGFPISQMHHIAFADWELGGVEALKEYVPHIHSMFIMRDIMAALVYLGMWPQEYYDEMDRRITIWNAET